MTFMKKIFSRYISILVVAAAFAACSDDDNTSDSTLAPTAPTVTVAIDHPTATLLEKDSTFGFTVTLSEPQIVDVAVYVEVSGGDATADDDFTYTSQVVIPANRKTASGSVSIKADDIPEDTETLEITIGDARTENAAITPAKMSFTILNEASTDLPLELSWNGIAYDANGGLVDPTAIADMRLLITDLDGNVIDGADGAGFESYTLPGDAPDGEYLVRADLFAALDIRDPSAIPTLDLTLEYSQAGVMAPVTLEFPSALYIGAVCEQNYYTLAKIIKTGNTYKVTRVAEAVEIKDLSSLEGKYNTSGGTGIPATATITVGSRSDVLVVTNFWRGAPLQIHSTVCLADGDFMIPLQAVVAASGPDAGQTFFISGTGTYSEGTLTANYRIIDGVGAEKQSGTVTYTFVPPAE